MKSSKELKERLEQFRKNIKKKKYSRKDVGF